MTLRTLHDLPARSLADMIDALESAAHRLGNATTFRLLLEEFAAREGSPGTVEADGQAAVVMPNGALSSVNRRERDIRIRMIEDGCVEALISLPPGLFYNAGVHVTIWLVSPPGTDRDEILFIDASGSGHMASRTHRELDDAEIGEIIRVVDAWRSGRPIEGSISAISVSLSHIREGDYDLNPSVYLSRPPAAADHETAMLAIRALIVRLEAQHDEADEKDASTLRVLKELTP